MAFYHYDVAMVINGKKIAEETLTELKKLPKPEKFLAAVLVGDDVASASFLKQKEKVAHELGVDFRIHRLAMSIDQDALRKEVLKIAQHQTCGGVVVQLPLPTHINRQYVLNAIPREKDVDVLGERALGAFYAGRNTVLPPAVGVVQKVLQALDFEPEGKKAIVIGRGLLIGRPIAIWLMGEVAELTVFNSTTQNLRGKLKDADIIVSGVGKAGLFSADDVKENAVVIDFGYARLPAQAGGAEGPDGKTIVDPRQSREKIHGDLYVSLSSSLSSSLAYTPTPGGTGPILVAQLFQNFFTLVASQK